MKKINKIHTMRSWMVGLVTIGIEVINQSLMGYVIE